MDVEGAAATMLVRALPLHAPGGEAGALVLVRDVTDVRRRDRALLTKDATIREIHHRVKNNLQTVAALLRLQARRMTEPAARAALEESVRRVASIAVVHETLAGSREDVVDVDDVLDQVLPMLGDLTSIGPAARTRRIGAFGELPAAAATPLVLAVTELLHNAAEHAFPDGEPGTIELVAERTGDDLVVRVRDDGRGLPEGFDPAGSDGLGLQIVRTLVTSELGGSLAMGTPDGQAAAPRPCWTCPAPACPAAEHDAEAGPGIRTGLEAVVRGASCGGAGPACSGQAVRTRVRAWRRFSARRSSSESPPQTPESWPERSAQSRHDCTTGQRRQTAFACSICTTAGPVVPIGKNSSGSSSRQSARWRQSMAVFSSVSSTDSVL